MAINYFCEKCKHCFSIKNTGLKKCPNCKNSLNFNSKAHKYRIRISKNGKKISEIYFGSLTAVRDRENTLKNAIKTGEYDKINKKDYTLNEAWKMYLETYQSRGKAWKREEQRYNFALKEKFGNKKISDIKSRDIEDYQNFLKESINKYNKTYSNKTIKNAVDLLSTIINYAIKIELYDKDNPCKKINKLKINNIVTNYLNDSEMLNLTQVLNEYQNQQVANLLKLCLFCGLRKGEAFNLKWQDVYLDSKRIELKDTKAGKDQIVHLNEKAVETLNNQLKYKNTDNPFVFSNKNNKKITDVSYDWKKIKKIAKINKTFRIHDLRHMFATMLANSNKVDIYTLQKLMRHTSTAMTQRYAHLIENSLTNATNVIDKIFSNLENSNAA